MPLRVLNDLHLGVNRSAGTTAASKLALKQDMLVQFKALLPTSDLMILGDLFDSYEVPLADMLDVFNVLREWCAKGYDLYLVPGNHDLSKTSTTLSSFQFLCALMATFSNTKVIDKPAMTPYGYVIPHLPNQTVFDLALANVPECDFLFLHCNYNNFFATQSDHSLNLSKEQATECKAKCIIIAHEHNTKVEGKVVLPGCQIASSVSDWQSARGKSYLEIGATSYNLVAHRARDTDYGEVDWRQLDDTTYPFMRIIGTAKTTEAAIVVNAIAKFRAKSTAFVISNAVQIESDEALGGFSEALESAQGFDVWNALSVVLSEPEMAILKELT